MFEHLARHRVILVTGPQRSGTTIAATMIAQDTGHILYLEEAFGVHDKALWQRLIKHAQKAVIQCPGMSAFVHEESGADVLVVWMERELADILASQERINWPPWDKAREVAKYGEDQGEPAAIKYRHWREWQRDATANYLELPFSSLAGHPLWVPKAERSTFAARQVAA